LNPRPKLPRATLTTLTTLGGSLAASGGLLVGGDCQLLHLVREPHPSPHHCIILSDRASPTSPRSRPPPLLGGMIAVLGGGGVKRIGSAGAKSIGVDISRADIPRGNVPRVDVPSVRCDAPPQGRMEMRRRVPGPHGGARVRWLRCRRGWAGGMVLANRLWVVGGARRRGGAHRDGTERRAASLLRTGEKSGGLARYVAKVRQGAPLLRPVWRRCVIGRE